MENTKNTKYFASDMGNISINKVEIISESDQFVTIKWNNTTKRRAKQTQYDGYFDTFNEAVNWLMDKHNRLKEMAESAAEFQQKKIDEILKLSEQ